jgi:iron complex transport system ATP-binding protein
MALQIGAVTLHRGATEVVRAVSLHVEAGAFVAVLGPNGAGKTSLLRAAVGLTKPSAGVVLVNGVAVTAMAPRMRAQAVAYLPQDRPLAWPLAVRDVVGLGRFAYGARLGRLAPDDRAAIVSALAACDLAHLADRRTDALSGGEVARVHLARVLASGARLLVLDEPIAALDPAHAFMVMQVLQRFVRDGGAVLASLHDVALADRFASRVVLLHRGGVAADGPPSQTLTPAHLREVFGVSMLRVDGRLVLDGL